MSRQSYTSESRYQQSDYQNIYNRGTSGRYSSGRSYSGRSTYANTASGSSVSRSYGSYGERTRQPMEGFQYLYGSEAPDLYRQPEMPVLPQEQVHRRAGAGNRNRRNVSSRSTSTASRRRQEQLRAASVRNSRDYARTAAARAQTAARPVPGTRPQVQHANPLAVLMVIGVVAIMSLFLIQYLQLQTQVTNTVQEVATLQSQYSKLKQSNDEALNQLNASINLDEIKYKAMTELGMDYPQEDQMVSYTNDDSDYVHQVTEVK